MEHYSEQPSEITHTVEEPEPFDQPSYTHFKVTKDKSARNFVNRALKIFGVGKPIVWTAVGRDTIKAVSCAEILKTHYSKKTVFQITRISAMKTVEVWEPQLEGLDPLRVTRTVPIIYILLSLEPLDEKEAGYQKTTKESKRVVVSPSDESSIVSGPMNLLL